MSYWQKICFSCVVLAAMCLAPANSFAKSQEEEAVSRVVAAMSRALKLTDAQVKEVAPAVREYIQQVEMLKADGVTGVAQQDKIRFLRDQMNSDLAHYLSEDQMVVWKKQMEQPKEKDNMAAVGNGGAPGGDKRNSLASVAPFSKDNGVFESQDSNKTKTSGIW